MTAPAPSNMEFIKKLREITLANISNENFGVNELAKNAGLNHSYLSQRLHKITNKSVSRFISEVRLEKAAEMLRNEGVTAAEAAYKVGFGSATYFNKCFHDFYGYPPGDLRKGSHLEPIDEIAKSELIDKKGRHFLKWNKKALKISLAAILVIMLFVSVWYFLINKNGSTVALKLSKNDKSIAVLPFKNLSNEKENQYFADGVMEDILNLLYRVGEFRVVSRTSVEQFRGSTQSSPEIAKKLGVNFILEGSVQRYGNKVRINVQLIDARHDRQILSEKYDREFADIFAIQSGIAKQVAGHLETVLSPNEQKQIEKVPTQNIEAYNLYLMGRFLWNRRTGEGIKKSIEHNSSLRFEHRFGRKI